MKKGYIRLCVLLFIFFAPYKIFSGIVSYVKSNNNADRSKEVVDKHTRIENENSLEAEPVAEEANTLTTEDQTSFEEWDKLQNSNQIVEPNISTNEKKKRTRKVLKVSDISMVELTCGIFDKEDCANFENKKKEVEKTVNFIENKIKRNKGDITLVLKNLEKDKSLYFSYFIIKNNYCIFDSERFDALYLEVDESLINSFKNIQTEGDWFFYPYFNKTSDIQYSFIKKIILDNDVYFIGSSIYPDQINLKIQQVLIHIKRIFDNNSVEDSLKIIKEQDSEFLIQLGDVNLTVIDKNETMVFSYNKTLENINIKEAKDNDGKYFLQEIIQKTKELKAYTLETNINGNKIIFDSILVETPEDSFIVVADYIEKITGEDVILLVSKIIQEININGLEKTLQLYTNLSSDSLNPAYPFKPVFLRLLSNEVKGDHSGSLNDSNMSLVTDVYGNNIFKGLLNNIDKIDKGWISFHDRKGYAEFYYESINTADGKYVIGCLCHPYSRLYHAKINVDNIMHRISNLTLEQIGNLILHSTANIFSSFLNLDIYNSKGVCLLTTDPKLKLFSNPFNTQQWNMILEVCKSGGGIYALKEKNYRIMNIVRLLPIKDKEYFLRIYYKE